MSFSIWAWGIGDRGLVTSQDDILIATRWLPHVYVVSTRWLLKKSGPSAHLPNVPYILDHPTLTQVKNNACHATCFHELPKIWISDKLGSLSFSLAGFIAYILGS